MKAIHRYEVKSPEATTLLLREGSRFLHAAYWKRNVSLWFEESKDLTLPHEERKFVFVGTGRTAPDSTDHEFLCTILLLDIEIVLHLYEKRRT